MLVCKKHKFVFIRNPKTASRSITEFLKNNFEVFEAAEYHSWMIPEEFLDFFVFMFVRNPYSRFVSRWQHNCSLKGWHKEMFGGHNGMEKYVDWIFCNTDPDCDNVYEVGNRHDVEKYELPTWWGVSRSGGNNKLFIKNSFLKQADLVDAVGTKIHCFKFENLDQEYDNLPFVEGRHRGRHRCGRASRRRQEAQDVNQFPLVSNIASIPVKGAGNYGNWKQFYTESLKIKVYNLLKIDFDTFNYSEDINLCKLS